MLVGATAAGVYAYDHGQRDTIAKGVTVGGVDVGGLTAAQAQGQGREHAARRRCNRRSSSDHGTPPLRPAPAQAAASASTSTARSTRRWPPRAQGGILARTWRELRGKRVDADVDARHHLLRRRRSASSSRASAGDVDRARHATRRWTSTGASSTRRPRRTASACARQPLRRAHRAPLLSTGPRHAVAVHTTVVTPKVTTSQLAAKYPAVAGRRPRRLHALALQDLKLAKTYPVAVGRRASRRPPGSTTSRTRRSTPPGHEPNSSWVAPADRGKVIPGGSPQQPAQGALAGHLRRRRHPRHRSERVRLDRPRRVARLRPHAHRRRRSSCTRRSRSARRSTSLIVGRRSSRRRRRDRDLLPAATAAGRHDGRSGEDQRADEDRPAPACA